MQYYLISKHKASKITPKPGIFSSKADYPSNNNDDNEIGRTIIITRTIEV